MRRTRTWVRGLARAGYSARGLVYGIVGVFAVLAALGTAAKEDTQGALLTLLAQPFGRVLVWVLVVGLLGYVLWRCIQALFDTDQHGRGAKGLAIRGGLLASAVTYTLLALYALALLGVFTGGAGGGGGGGQGPVAGALASVVGARWVSLALAAIFAGVAAAHVFKAVTQRYEEHFEAPAPTMRKIHPLAMAGLVARGLVFAVIALLLFYRFQNASGPGSGESRPGLDDALSFVQGLPYGAWLLGAMGVGLMAFAAYSFAEARWRRINVEDA